VSILLIIITLAVIGASGYFVSRQVSNRDQARDQASNRSKPPSVITKATPAVSTDLKTYCDGGLAACITYPETWAPVPGFSGEYEDPAETSVVSLIPGLSQDVTPNSAYIYSINPLMVGSQELDIVGYIVSNQPGYVVYEASYVASADIKVGANRLIVDGNYAFAGKLGSISLVATPGPNGFADIANFTQAEAWFSTPSSEAALKSLQSLYYE
jgi:hypothetical protein